MSYSVGDRYESHAGRGCTQYGWKEKPVRTDLEYHNEIIETLPFAQWAGWGKGVGASVDVWVGDLRYVVTLRQRFEARDDDDSYGDYEATQGWEGEAYLVFEISFPQATDEPPIFFKKYGTVSSYYRTSWDGKFERVYPKKKEVVTYEFE